MLKKLFRIAVVVGFLGMLWCPVSADELYIRNRPFQGLTATLDGELWVELDAFAMALKVDLIPSGNHVVVSDTEVPIRNVDGVNVVPLREIAKLVGATVKLNKDFGILDVNFAAEAGSVSGTWGNEKPVEEKKTEKSAAPPSNIVRFHGKITLQGADQVGLFEGGSATVPYKVGKVDKNGNYTLDIDVTKDMHEAQPGYLLTDIRFFKDGAFESVHGRCNFFYYSLKDRKGILAPYGTEKKIEVNGNSFEFNEEY